MIVDGRVRWLSFQEEVSPNGEGAKDVAPTGKLFSQSEVDSMMAADKRRHKERADKAVAELEKLKEALTLTQKDRESLEEQIENIRSQYKTEQELAHERAVQEKKNLENRVSQAEEFAQTWKQKFDSQLKNTQLLEAATSGGAFNPSQLVTLLSRDATVVEEIVDGKPTGAYKTVVKFDTRNEEGEPVQLMLTPGDAVARMKKDVESFGNLFTANIKGGLGGMRPQDEASEQVRAAEKNMGVYLEMRKKNPRALGL